MFDLGIISNTMNFLVSWQLFTPQLCECHVLNTQTFKKMRNTLENYTLENYTWLVCEIFLRHKREKGLKVV